MAVFDKILRLKGKQFDAARSLALQLLIELFPDTARSVDENEYGMLEWWERMFNIIPPSGATYSERRAAVVAAECATGGLKHEYFVRLAEALDYTYGVDIRFTEGDFLPARAGFMLSGLSAVWNQDPGASSLTWCVRGDGVESDVVLQEIFNKAKTKGTEILFINE